MYSIATYRKVSTLPKPAKVSQNLFSPAVHVFVSPTFLAEEVQRTSRDKKTASFLCFFSQRVGGKVGQDLVNMFTPLACFAPCTNENYCSSCSGHQLMCWYHVRIRWKQWLTWQRSPCPISKCLALRLNLVQLETWVDPKSCCPRATTKKHRKDNQESR